MRLSAAAEGKGELELPCDVSMCCLLQRSWFLTASARARRRSSALSVRSCLRFSGSAHPADDITEHHASLSSTMALRELGARLSCALRTDARPCLSVAAPLGRRNASSSPAADSGADLEEASSFAAPPPDGEIINTWDPIARQKQREKPLPSSRCATPQLVLSWHFLQHPSPLASTNASMADTSSDPQSITVALCIRTSLLPRQTLPPVCSFPGPSLCRASSKPTKAQSSPT